MNVRVFIYGIIQKKGVVMCIMCIEIFKGKMTIQEGRVALRELLATTSDAEQLAHYRELEGYSDEQFLEKINEIES